MTLEWNETERVYCAGLVGIPYSDTGDTREGCYCVGLVCLFFRDHGMECPNPCTRVEADVVDGLHGYFRRVDFPRYGDVILLPPSPGDGGHLGIWTPEGVLHSTHRGGVVRTRRFATIAIYRHLDVLD